TSLIHGNTSYRTLDDTTYTRRDVTYARTGVEVQVADVVRLSAKWPHFELCFVDTAHNVVYELAGSASCVHWLPDHVYSMLYSYALFPNFEFQGKVTVKGVTEQVKGKASFDHISGRNLAAEFAAKSRGVGYWLSDPIQW